MLIGRKQISLPEDVVEKFGLKSNSEVSLTIVRVSVFLAGSVDTEGDHVYARVDG